MKNRDYRHIFALALLLLTWMPVNLLGQVIQTDPEFPTQEEPVTITFDASQAERNELEGFTGDVYAHTGVITSEEDKDSGNWSFVVSEWGENLPKLKLTPVEDNVWELQIDNIREFYDLPESVDRIFQLAFVFRSADASMQSEDLFIDISENVLSVRFNQPDTSTLNPFFAELNDIVEFEIVGTSPAGTLTSIRLLKGDEEIASVSNSNTLTHNYEVSTSGKTQFVAVAEDETNEQARDSLFIIVNPETPVQPRPDGIEDGITYHQDNPGKVTFSLFAPGKEFVYLIGDFNDWQVDPQYLMNRDDTGSFGGPHYWIEIDGLEPGKEYGFQYLVDGEIRVADLFSKKVLDPWNDGFLIDDGVYTNLKPYPQGKTEEMVGVIEPGAEEFTWEAVDYQKPDPEELVVYELLIRDFFDQGTYANLADTLAYFEQLGVNAIELMPVSEFDGNISWGYNPAFHFALDKAYGPAEEFKRFVDEAHKRDIAVILDVVYNHATGQSPLIRLNGSNPETNPLVGPGHEFNVFNHLNHDNAYIQYWLDRVNKFWLDEYNVDGYRFDLTKGFAANTGVSSNVNSYNEGRVENLKRMSDELWSTHPEAIVILEHFQRQEEVEIAEHGQDGGHQGVMFWNNMNFQYNEASMGYDSDLRGTHFSQINGLSTANSITFMESHDEQWLMLKNRKFGNSSSDGSYDVTEIRTALERQKAVGAFFLTVPGPRMLWQFGELGYGGNTGECLKPGNGTDGDCSPSDPGRTDPKPVRWDYFDVEIRKNLFRSWSELLRLRNENPVFTSRDTQFEASLTEDVKWIRLLHTDMDAMIIGNFDVESQTSTFTFPATGDWYDFISGDVLTVDNTNQEFTLLPGEIRLYTSEFVEPAGENVFVSLDGDANGTLPEQFRLNPNYPNPFNPSTTISYEVPRSAPVTIQVFDMLGREVSTLVDESRHTAGSFTIQFDASGLSSGVYFTRLETAGKTFIQKMSLIK
ncbi:MAG: T9SS type A sorting domain-containing protein [Bacteroidetes bacterium]|jgi:1,4-alpha-glucan branching enzyme|nr:T9SS type A sorting domain-containing protein [Bacteroidota bacterium]